MRPLARLQGIVKRYGDVIANDHVSLEIEAGEVHALLGENGAGKTTLMNVFYGLARADAGWLEFEGRETAPRSPRDAISLGIGMVHQHPLVVGSLTVAENLLLGGVGDGTASGVRAAAKATASAMAFDVDPTARMDSLPVSQRQRVEIFRCLARGVKLLILDEPTAVLTPAEVSELFGRLRKFADEGRAVVLITHRLSEVVEIADRVTVLRRGRKVGTWPRGAVSSDELATAMVGRMPEPVARPRVSKGIETPRLSARNCSGADLHGQVGLESCELDVSGGEILGVAGVEGNGQTVLAELLFGLRMPATGTIEVEGRPMPLVSSWLSAGIRVGRIPADRSAHGLVPDAPLWENLLTGPYAPGWLSTLRRKAAVSRAREVLESFDVRPPDPYALGRELSGGNQQKVVLARELSVSPRTVVAVNPTRGLDLGAQSDIQRRLSDLRSEGVAIVLISTDLDEIMALSDRIGVLYKGTVRGPYARTKVTREDIGRLMAGLDVASTETTPAVAAEQIAS